MWSESDIPTFLEDIRSLILAAGVGGRRILLLLHDSALTVSAIGVVNDLLMGKSSVLSLSADDVERISASLREEMKIAGAMEMWDFFLLKVSQLFR